MISKQEKSLNDKIWNVTERIWKAQGIERKKLENEYDELQKKRHALADKKFRADRLNISTGHLKDL